MINCIESQVIRYRDNKEDFFKSKSYEQPCTAGVRHKTYLNEYFLFIMRYTLSCFYNDLYFTMFLAYLILDIVFV